MHIMIMTFSLSKYLCSKKNTALRQSCVPKTSHCLLPCRTNMLNTQCHLIFDSLGTVALSYKYVEYSMSSYI